MHVHRSLLVLHPAERMFDLIEGAEHYPAFLPWCAAATILERNDALVAARLTIAVRGFRFTGGRAENERRFSELEPTDHSVTSFGEDAAGEVYILTAGGGVYRIVPR